MPLAYRDIRDIYGAQRDLGLVKETLPEWSKKMNVATGTSNYDEGLRDNWWRRWSTAADVNFFEPVASVTTEPLAGAIGSAFGGRGEEIGRRVGKSLPRAVAQTIPLVAAEVFSGGLATPLVAAGAVATGGLFGAQTYAETGSGKAALISGTAAAALPGVGGVGGRLAMRAVPEAAAAWLPRIARFGGSQAAQIGMLQAAQYAESRTLGTEYEPLSPEFWAQQIPFTVMDLVGSARTPKARPTAEPQPTRTTTEYAPPPSTDEQRATVEATLRKLTEVYLNPAASQLEKESALAAADGVVKDPTKVIPLARGKTEPMATVTGWGRLLDNGNMKLLVKNAEGIDVPEHGNVFLNANPELESTVNPDGTMTVRTPVKHVNPRVTSPYVHSDFGVDLNTPDLPVQPTEFKGLAPDERRALVTKGVAPGPLEAEVEAALKPVAQKIEEQESRLLQAKDKITVVPKSAEEIPQLLDSERAKPQIEQKIKADANPTQAVESVRLQQNTPQIDEAQQLLNQLQGHAQEIVKPEFKGREVLSWGASLLDEEGKRRYFTNAGDAERFLNTHRQENPQDKTDWETTSRKVGDKRRWFVASRLGKKSILEAAPGAEEGQDFINMLDRDPVGVVKARGQEYADNLGRNVEATASDLVASEDRPDVSFDDMLSQLDVASRNPRAFSNEAGLDVPDSILAIRQARVVFPELREGRASLEQLNKTLAKAKVPGFVDETDMRNTLRNVRAGLVGFTRQRAFSLGSEQPFDEEITRRTGIRERGIDGFLDWFTNLKESGLGGQLLAAMRPAHDSTGLKFTFNPHDGFVYERNTREINVPYFPRDAADAVEWGYKVAHEYIHDAARELYKRQDPVAVRFRATLTSALNAMKNSPEIPKAVRNATTNAKAWMEEFRKTSGSPEAAGEFYNKFVRAVGVGNEDWLHVFYGLSNEEEMLSEMFGSPKMIEVMRKTKMPEQPLTVLQWFSKVWNRMFNGKVDSDNVLGEILQRFDNYLAGTIIRPTRDGIVRRVVQQYNGRDFIRDSLIATGVRPEALASRLSTVESLFATGDLSHSINGFQRESNAGTLPATSATGDVHPEITKALTTGEIKDVYARTLGLLVDDVPLHNDLWARMKEDVDVAKNLYQAIKKGQLISELPPNTPANIKLAQVKLNSMKRALDKQATAISRFNDLSNFTGPGMERTFANNLVSDRLPAPPDPTPMASMAHQLLGLKDEQPTERTKATRAELEEGKIQYAAKQLRYGFMFTQYLKQLVPEIRQTIDNLYRQQGQAFKRSTELDFVYNADPTTKELDPKIIQSNRRVANTPSLSRAASDIKLFNQLEERQGRAPSLDDPFVKKILSRFNEKDRADIITESNSALHRHDHWIDQTAPQFLAEKNLLTTARVIVARETGMRTAMGKELSRQMFDALNSMEANPVAGQQALQQLSQRMSADTFLKALEVTRGLIEDTTKHLEFMKSRRYYVTEQRFDNHRIRMITPNGDPYYKDFPTKDAALARVKALEKDGYRFLDYTPKSDANVPGGVSAEVRDKMFELDQQAANRLADALKDKPEVLAMVLPATQRAAEYEASKAAFSAVPGAGFPRRKFVAGREELNMVDNDHLFYQRANNWIRHQLVREESALDMLEPDLMSNRTATKWARQSVDNFLSNDSQFARKLSEYTYHWKLSFNFGVNFLHFIQSFNTGMASLISETGAVGDAFKYTVKAQKAVWQRIATGKWENSDHDWLDRRGSSEGTLGYATWEGDIGDRDLNKMYDSKTPPWTKPVEGLKWAARSWNNWFFRYNDRIGLISAFDLAKERGMDHEAAFQFARDVKNRGYFTGGKAQRSIGQWSVKTKAVPQLMSSLQTYVQGWFSNLAYNYIRGFGKGPAELTMAQRSAAKRAFLYQMGAQAVLAGALGLPGVGQGMALVKQTTGVDVMGWLRQHLSDFFQEDQDGGGLMTTLALHGAVAAVTPVDPSGRHMPSVPYIGVSPYKGFDVAQLAGAPISGAAQLVQGVMAAAKGDVAGMSKLLPAGLTGPFELFKGGGADVRDRQGNLITTMTPAEQFVTALGMKPSRITQLKDVNAAAKEASTRASKEKTGTINGIAKEYVNNPELARQKLLEYVNEHPEDDYQTLSSTVAHHVADQTIPFDWRRHVNVGAELLGLGSRAKSTEVDRRNLIYQVQATLGVMPRRNPHADSEAEDIDTLLDSNPNMSRAQAIRQIHSSRPRRRSALVEANGQ